MSHIVRFPRTRGRPKTIRPEKDSGTPELQQKRAEGVTAETLDLCFEKGLITQEQHWCGIHLRWLYTLRYGAPGVRAIDHNHVIGLEMNNDDPLWREAREAEYHEAMKRISERGVSTLLTNICIHNERPDFLFPRRRKKLSWGEDLEQLREGLDILATHWKRHRREKCATE